MFLSLFCSQLLLQFIFCITLFDLFSVSKFAYSLKDYDLIPMGIWFQFLWKNGRRDEAKKVGSMLVLSFVGFCGSSHYTAMHFMLIAHTNFYCAFWIY